MDLAYHFKRPDKDRMLEEMSSVNLTEWYVYLSLLDEERKAEEEADKPRRAAAAQGKPATPASTLSSLPALANLPKGTSIPLPD